MEFLIRLKEEQQELETKINKLTQFLNTKDIKEKVSRIQHDLLTLQVFNMMSYNQVLILRIENLTKNK